VQWGFLLHKSTGLERDRPNRLVAVTRPHSHSAYDGNPLCPQGPYARQDTHVLFRNGQCPTMSSVFFPLPLSLISLRAFSHGVSFSHPVAIQCLMLWMRLACGTDWPLALRNRASASRVKVPLA